MSTELVENIPQRIREEISLLGLSLAETSRRAGESSPQRLKDVLSGRQKCPADLVAKLASLGVDIFYVLTGERSVPESQPLGLPIGGSGSVDVEQLVRIADRLDVIAQAAGKRLPVAKLVEIAADVYNYFQHEEGIEDEEKLNRTLKLVVSR